MKIGPLDPATPCCHGVLVGSHSRTHLPSALLHAVGWRWGDSWLLCSEVSLSRRLTRNRKRRGKFEEVEAFQSEARLKQHKLAVGDIRLQKCFHNSIIQKILVLFYVKVIDSISLRADNPF